MDENELVELERGFWLEATGDLYRARMADDGLMVLGPAGVLDKAATVAAIEASAPWRSVDMDDIRVVRLADDAAALVYLAAGRRPDVGTYRARISSVYARRDGRWMLTLHQQAPLP